MPSKTMIDSILVHPESRNSELIARFTAQYPKAQVQFSDVGNNLKNDTILTPSDFAKSKRSIYIRPKPEQFIRRCPGFSPNRITKCCSFHVIDLGKGCNFNCSYCFLQSQTRMERIEIYSNINDLTEELKKFYSDEPESEIIFGMGELVDSLSLDPVTLNTNTLFPLFQNFKRWTLDLKTKSANVDQFLHIQGSDNIYIHWGVNPETVIAREELLTDSLALRLDAAEKCMRNGYRIGFKFFPMIYFENWKQEYNDLVHQITSRFSKSPKPIFISIGPLQMNEDLITMTKERFPNELLGIAEKMIRTEKKEFRYPAGLRREMFNFIADEFRNSPGQWTLHNCPSRFVD